MAALYLHTQYLCIPRASVHIVAEKKIRLRRSRLITLKAQVKQIEEVVKLACDVAYNIEL